VFEALLGIAARFPSPLPPSPLPLRGAGRGEILGFEAGGFAARLKPPLFLPLLLPVSGRRRGLGG